MEEGRGRTLVEGLKDDRNYNFREDLEGKVGKRIVAIAEAKVAPGNEEGARLVACLDRNNREGVSGDSYHSRSVARLGH